MLSQSPGDDDGTSGHDDGKPYNDFPGLSECSTKIFHLEEFAVIVHEQVNQFVHNHGLTEALGHGQEPRIWADVLLRNMVLSTIERISKRHYHPIERANSMEEEHNGAPSTSIDRC